MTMQKQEVKGEERKNWNMGERNQREFQWYFQRDLTHAGLTHV